MGREWVNWTFEIVSSTLEKKKLSEGISKYTAFWAKKHDISLVNTTFKVKIKNIDAPQDWQQHFLRNQMSKPWETVGTAVWEDNKFKLNIADIK